MRRIGMWKHFLTIYISGKKRSQRHMIGVLKKSLQLSGKKSVKEIRGPENLYISKSSCRFLRRCWPGVGANFPFKLKWGKFPGISLLNAFFVKITAAERKVRAAETKVRGTKKKVPLRRKNSAGTKEYQCSPWFKQRDRDKNWGALAAIKNRGVQFLGCPLFHAFSSDVKSKG